MARPPGKSSRSHSSVESQRVETREIPFSSDLNLSQPAIDPALWHLDPEVTFLNHGSFGACPKSVLAHQQKLRELLEREPVDFLVRGFEERLDAARDALARFVGADSQDIVFVPNATTGLNTVLRSLRFNTGDELLVTDHEYNASRNALDFAASLWGAKVVVAKVPFPLTSEAEIESAILTQVTGRTRLALLDHVTSQTGMIVPIESLTRQLEERGVQVLVDGAHAPGMLPLNLSQIGASYYTGNCHKWICAPKGAAFLFVRRDRQESIRPLVISHGANSPRKDRSRFLLEFGWTGTWDPTAMLSIPAALEFMETAVPGGWPALMRRNRELALAARRVLCHALEIEPPCPDSLIGSLASLPIADSVSRAAPKSPLYLDDLQERLFSEFRIEVPVVPWPAPPRRLLRISAQAYNSLPQYEKLAASLCAVL
jgi:isopenicillin-N epimerase